MNFEYLKVTNTRKCCGPGSGGQRHMERTGKEQEVCEVVMEMFSCYIVFRKSLIFL